MVSFQDFPAMEPSDMSQDSEEFFSNGSIDDMTDCIIILGQQDPTEVMSDGHPRWTEDQRALIIKAADKVADWRAE